MNYKVKILLATFNGERYISTQLESIINQSYFNWEVLISDDGSNESTLSLIKSYCAKDRRIRIVNDSLINQGACQNFASLLKFALNEEWDFLMFADQDDLWYENKIQLTLNSMINADNFNENPTLVYTDFLYADEKLMPLPDETDKNTSSWIEPNLNSMLVQNNIYGCTIMINRSLAEKVNPIPMCAENHDHWISLVAISIGEVIHLKEPTMLYRQHSNNVSGHYTNNSFSKRFKRFFGNWEKLENSLLSSHKQAFELLHRYDNELIFSKKLFLKEYHQLFKNKSFWLLPFCYKNGIKRNTLAQNIMLSFLSMKLFILRRSRF